MQQTVRTRTGASPADVTHYVHDIWGNVIAETDGGGPTGATGTVREYIYLPEAEIAPTFGSRTTVDRPVGVVDAVNTASPVLWFVHVDHLNRPVKMTNTAKAAVWDAVFLPPSANADNQDCCGVHAITGSATLDARFPGQWFQLESGLHYNWHRQYDPSIGRYIQADPLGFVDGPSVYGYVSGSPQLFTDADGLNRRRPPAGSPPMNFPVGAGTPRPVQPATQCVRTYTVPATINRINQGQRNPHRNDGTIFQNREGPLPQQPPGYYREYVVGTPGLTGPGPQRIVTGANGEMYYTPNHYQTFTPIVP